MPKIQSKHNTDQTLAEASGCALLNIRYCDVEDLAPDLHGPEVLLAVVAGAVEVARPVADGRVRGVDLHVGAAVDLQGRTRSLCVLLRFVRFLCLVL